MPEELTEAQLAELVQRLHDLRAELRKTLRTTGEHAQTVELDQASVGRLSRMDAIQQQQMADAQRRRNELRLKQIAVALMAVDDDEYGDCKVCGEPIGFARLRARPESPACVSCMAELERGQ